MRIETILLRIAGALALAALLYVGWRDYDLARGLYDYYTGKNSEGIGYFSNAIASNQLSRWEKALAYLGRAQLYGRSHDYLATAEDAGSALSLLPDYTAARLTRAGAFMLTRNYPGAREDLDAILALDPNNVTARRLRGNLLWQMGDWKEAIADYVLAERAEHQTPYFYFQRGNALAQVRVLGGAVAAYDAALAGDPDMDEAYRNRGVVYLALGDLGDARNDFDSAIRLNPRVADWYAGRGDVYAAAGGFSEAVKNYDIALGMDDTLLVSHRNRAFANFGRAHFDEAAKEFDLCATRAPHDPYIALWRYIAHARAGDGDAKDQLEAASAGIDSIKWPGPAIGMFLGRTDPPSLIDIAMSAPPQTRVQEDCEATSFIGEYEMIEGDQDKAKIMFQRVANGCHPATLAHASAIAELDRMAGAQQ